MLSGIRIINKSYLHLIYNPTCRKIAKAYKVLEKNETRALFDFYLDNPTQYFRVSGDFYLRAMPKSDIRLVIILFFMFVSLLQYLYQNSKYQSIVKKLFDAALNNLTEKQGGSRETQELYELAKTTYEDTINSGM